MMRASCVTGIVVAKRNVVFQAQLSILKFSKIAVREGGGDGDAGHATRGARGGEEQQFGGKFPLHPDIFLSFA